VCVCVCVCTVYACMYDACVHTCRVEGRQEVRKEGIVKNRDDVASFVEQKSRRE